MKKAKNPPMSEKLITKPQEELGYSGAPVQIDTPPRTGTVNEQPKVDPKAISISAVMSVPRLGFQDNFFCAFQALLPLKIPIRKGTGAFWGQCMERVMEESINADHPTVLLTLDYDTVFRMDDVGALARLMVDHPEADAIASIQSHRYESSPLMTIRGADGQLVKNVAMDYFMSDLSRVSTAHFGLTMIRTEKLLKMPHPWFWSKPGADGRWGEGKIDDDIYFWRQWEAAGNTLYLANRVVVGHSELMIRWPGRQFRTVYQHPNDFYRDGVPQEAWQ